MDPQPDVAAFQLSGGPVSELVAIDSNGRFCVHELPQPVEEELNPVVSSGVAYYFVDGTVYAFSGDTGTWDAIKAPDAPQTSPVMGRSIGAAPIIPGMTIQHQGVLMLHFPDKVAAFSLQSGRWSTAQYDKDTKVEESN
jgi:hypothetical protein